MCPLNSLPSPSATADPLLPLPPPPSIPHLTSFNNLSPALIRASFYPSAGFPKCPATTRPTANGLLNSLCSPTGLHNLKQGAPTSLFLLIRNVCSVMNLPRSFTKDDHCSGARQLRSNMRTTSAGNCSSPVLQKLKTSSLKTKILSGAGMLLIREDQSRVSYIRLQLSTRSHPPNKPCIGFSGPSAPSVCENSFG